jgi:RNA polymerase sigma-70 factor (ECF subfamily)
MTKPSVTTFEAQRARLLGIAYRMLGEMAGAEDVVQEAWLRWQRTDEAEIRDPRAWLSAVTVRLALDALRRARARRETYVGPWLPEPLVPDDMRTLAADAPAARAELASDLSLALLHVLERLTPEERAAFILHDAFDCDYRDIAATLDKTEEACRKLVSRARERVRADRPRHNATAEQHRELIAKFSAAVLAQDQDRLMSLFAPDIVFYSDGGGRVSAALNPVYGADHVARLVVGLARKGLTDPNPEIRPSEINGQFALAIREFGTVHSLTTIEAEDGRITAVYVIRNPDKLARMAQSISGETSPGSSASA